MISRADKIFNVMLGPRATKNSDLKQVWKEGITCLFKYINQASRNLHISGVTFTVTFSRLLATRDLLSAQPRGVKWRESSGVIFNPLIMKMSGFFFKSLIVSIGLDRTRYVGSKGFHQAPYSAKSRIILIFQFRNEPEGI